MMHRAFLTSLSLLVLLVLLQSGSPAADERTELWTASLGATPAERTLLATVQGLANRQRCRLWIRSGGLDAHLLAELASEATIHPLADVWTAVDAFKDDIAGMVVYSAKDLSLTTATSLCGVLGAVAVEEALLPSAAAHGLRLIKDARGLDQLQVWAEYHDRFARGMLVEQDPHKEWHLRDFAVARSAFVFWQLDDQAVARLLRESGPATTVFGWGADERHAVGLASAGGGDYLAADWSTNLSALSRLPVALPLRPRPPPPADARSGERIVAFVMSDGDNLCFVGGGFADDPSYFGSPQRGTFDMTWEMAPRLAELSSRGLRYLYRSASHGPHYDDFVIGPSGVGYCFPSRQSDRPAYARRTAAAATASGMELVTLLNDGGSMTDATAMLEQPEIKGVLYKDWAPYNARHGAVLWHNGKPCISYRYLLWEGMAGQDPAGVAAAMSSQPAAPLTDEESYALINVHAWSWKSSGGPMAAVARTIGLLPAGTRVVTASALVALMTRHLAGLHPVIRP